LNEKIWGESLKENSGENFKIKIWVKSLKENVDIKIVKKIEKPFTFSYKI
jgi:hypothetical protein